MATTTELISTLAAIASSSSKDDDLMQEVHQDLLAAITLVLGPVVCYWGHKFWEYIVLGLGFIIGAWLTYGFCEANGAPHDVTLYTSLTVGVVLGAVLYTFVPMAIFVTGMVFGLLGAQFLIGLLSSAGVNLSKEAYYIFVVLVMVAAGFIVYWVWEQVVSIVTAVLGSWMFTSAFVLLLQNMGADIDTWFSVDTFMTIDNEGRETDCDATCGCFITLWALMAITGALYQTEMLGCVTDLLCCCCDGEDEDAEDSKAQTEPLI